MFFLQGTRKVSGTKHLLPKSINFSQKLQNWEFFGHDGGQNAQDALKSANFVFLGQR